MTSPIRRWLALLLSLAMLAALPRPAFADDAKPLDQAAIKTMVQNMGYETKDNEKNFQIKISDKYVYYIVFDISGDQKSLFVYFVCGNYSADEKKRLDPFKLLYSNDLGPQFFSMHDYGDSTTMYLQMALPMSAVTPVALRYTIDELVERGNGTADLWNKNLWK